MFTHNLNNLPPGVTDRMIEEESGMWEPDDADEDGKNFADDDPLDDEFDQFDDDQLVRKVE